jgi:hypothetical protein
MTSSQTAALLELSGKQLITLFDTTYVDGLKVGGELKVEPRPPALQPSSPQY